LDYFWYIKYQHVYIYIFENGREKKKKRISLLNGPGGILARLSERAATRAAGPSRPANGHGTETTLWAWAYVPARGRGKRRQGGNGGPPTGRRNWPVGGRGGGIAWARVGGHSGGENFVDGGLERADHSEVAGPKRR
jgi:hypothetical protein